MNGLRPHPPTNNRLMCEAGGNPGIACPPVAQAGKPGPDFYYMPTIDPTPAITYYGENVGTEARLPAQTLDQEAFLKLLVAQMTSQDPLNPKTDIEMIPQLVSFSTLAQSP